MKKLMNTNSFSTAIKSVSILLVALLFSISGFAAAPAAPTGVTAVKVSLTSAVVSFTPGLLNGNTPSSPAFTITPYLSGVAGTTVTCNTSPFVVTGLTSGGNYTFTVTENSSGGNTASAASTAITLAANAAPTAPTIGTAYVVGTTSEIITFTAPATPNGTIISYTATSSPGSLTGTVSVANGQTVPQSGTVSILVTGLTASTGYTFTVTASNGTTSTASAASTSVTTAASTATAPLNPLANIASPSTANVYFNLPTTANGSTVYGYTVKAYTTSGSTLTSTAYGSTSPVLVSGLTNGVSYYFTVTAQSSTASINSNTVTLGTVATNTFSLAGTSQASPGDWNTAGNWSAGHVPTANENVTIPGGFFVVNNGTAVANSITINSSGASTASIGYLKNSSTGTLTVIQNYSTATTGIYLNATNATYYGAIFDNEGTLNIANFANGNIGCVGFNYAPDYTGSNPDYRNNFIANGTINVYSSECAFFCSVSTNPTVGVGEITGNGTINFGAPVSGGGYSASSATNGSFISPFLLKGGYTYVASTVTIQEYFYNSNTGQLVYQNAGSFTNNGNIYLIGATYNNAAFGSGRLGTIWNMANGTGATLNWTNNGTFGAAGFTNGGNCLSSANTGTITTLANCNIANTGTIYLNTAAISSYTINTAGTGASFQTNQAANVAITNSGTINMGGSASATIAISFTTSTSVSIASYGGVSTQSITNSISGINGTINIYSGAIVGNYYNNAGTVLGTPPTISNAGTLNFAYTSATTAISYTALASSAGVQTTLTNTGTLKGFNCTLAANLACLSSNFNTGGTITPTVNGSANGTITLPTSTVLYGTFSPQITGVYCGSLAGTTINLSNAALTYPAGNTPTVGTNYTLVSGSPNTGNFVLASAPTNAVSIAETGVTTATAAAASTGYAYTTSATLFKSQYFTTPTAPIVTSATLTPGNGSVTAAFSAPSNTGGGVGGGIANGYTVTALGTNGPDNGNSYTGQGSTTTVPVSGLTYGTDYSFTVTASNIAGTSASASITGTSTPSNNAPGLPTINSVVNGDGVALITFTGPSSYGAGATTSLTYTITAATGGFTTTIGPNTLTGTQTVLATGLGASNTVTITVKNSNNYTSAAATATTSTTNISFLGTVDNTWENANNWTANTLPTSSDNVTITNNAVTIASSNTSAVANTITISPSGTGSLTNAGTLVLTGGFTLSSSGTASLSNTGTFTANTVTLAAGTSAVNTGTLTVNTATASTPSISLTDATFDNEGTLNVTTASSNCVSFAGSAGGANSNTFTANGTLNFISTTAGFYVFVSAGTDAVNILGTGFQIGTSTVGVSTGVLSSTGNATITIGSSGSLNGTVITEYFVYSTGTGRGISLTAGTLKNYSNLTITQSTTTSTVAVYPVYLSSQGASLPINFNNYGTFTSAANGSGNAIGIYLLATTSGGTINVNNSGSMSLAVTYGIQISSNLNTTITNSGTMSIVTSGSVTVYAGIEFNSSSTNTLQFNNTGTLNLQTASGGGRSIYFASNPGSSPNIANTGTINITAGPIDYATTTGSAGTITNNTNGVINFNYSASTAVFQSYSSGTVVPILTNSGGTIAGYNASFPTTGCFVSSTGTLAPQYTATGSSTITLPSGYTLTGTLAPQILSATHYGQLVAPSLVATSATLSIVPTSYTPTAGTSFNFVNWTSGSSAFSSITSDWGANYSGSNIVATYYTVPGTPTALTPTPGNNSVSVAFTAPASTGGGITNYTVTTYTLISSVWTPTGSTVTSASSPINVSGLTNGTDYEFSVAATNAAGTSSQSSLSAIATPFTSTDAPTSLSAVAGDMDALVSFTPSAGYGNGSSIATYTVTSNPVGGTGSGSSSPIHVTGLTNGTSYTFTIIATNNLGDASASSSASAAVTPSTSIYWTGNAGTLDWNTGNNWSGGDVPLAADNVTISGAHAITNSATAVANTITLASSASITNSGTLTISGATGTTTNSLIIPSGTTVTNNGTLSITAAVSGYAGVYMTGGTFTSTTSNLSINTSATNTLATGSCIYAASGTNTINISGGSLVAGNATNALNALCVAGGTTTLGGTGFTIGTSVSSGVSYRLIQISTATLIINSGVNLTAYYNGTYQYSTPIYISGASTFTNNGIITLTPTTALPFGFYGMSVNVANNLTSTFNNGGTYTYNGTYQGIIMSPSGTITTAGNYNVNNTGTISMTGTGGSGFSYVTPLNFNLTNSGNITLASSTPFTSQAGSQTQVASTGSITNTGTITLSRGNINIAYRSGDAGFAIANNTNGIMNFNFSSANTALTATPGGSFSSSTVYGTVGALIAVNGYEYEVVTAGTVATVAPTWGTSVGTNYGPGATNGAVFKCLALPTAPVLTNSGGTIKGYNCTFATGTLVTNTSPQGTITPSVNGSSVGTITLPSNYSLYGTLAPQITSATAYGQIVAPSLVGTHTTLTLSPSYTPSTSSPTSFNLVNNSSAISTPTSFSSVPSSPWVVNYSNGNYITATYSTIPGAPTTVTAAADNASAEVSFTPPVSNGGVAITSYKVYVYANGSGTASLTPSYNVSGLTLVSGQYTVTVSPLTNGTPYTFAVSATNNLGEGNLSTPLSNSVTPSSTTTWNGTSWSATSPDASQSAIIAANLDNSNPVGTFSTCANLTINAGVTFTMNSNVTVNGAFVNNGTITGSGTLTLAGGSAQSISGNGIVGNLTINNSNGVTVSSGSNSLGVSGILTLQSGTLTTNGNLTMKSLSISNSGVVAPIGTSGNSGSISGNVTVERFIPSKWRSYRDLSAAGVYASGNTLYNTWQNSGSYSKSGYGLFITGATSTAGSSYSSNHVDNGTGGTYLDYSLNSYPSASYWNTASQHWTTVTNTNTTSLNPYQGYRILVRGDRGFDLYTTPILNYPNGERMYDSTALRVTGSLIYGNVTYSTSGVTNSVTGSAYTSSTYGLSSAASGLSYIANPYDCPIDFHNIYANGRISNMLWGYWYLDPTIGETGNYVVYNAIANVTNTGYSNGNFIQAGQGFLVGNYHVDGTHLPSIQITEADKSTASSSRTSVFGVEAPTSKLFVGLLKGSTRVDGVAVVFGNNFSNGIGLEDSRKLSGGTDNISIKEGSDYLSIDGRLPATSSDVLGINMGKPSTTSYQLRIDASEYINEGYAPLLYDAYKNTTRALSGVDTVSFTVDASTAATYANRFSIIFTPSALAVNSIVASATLNNKVATISWNTVGEKGESRFEVEKSTDGKTFASIGQQAAKNTSTASYSTTDNNLTATSYYRIKAVSETGAVNYSNVAKLTTNNSPLITVYPNPLVGKTLNVQVANVAAGKYVVSIYNVLGEKVAEQTITHNGGSTTHALTINKTLAGGVYSVVIREASSNQIVHQTSISVQP